MQTVKSPLPVSNPRVSARIPAHAYETITRAAEIMGATINQFMIQSALEKASHVIEKERIIKLSAESAAVFYEAIELPPAPNEKLINAAKAYKKMFLNDQN
ncbi:conserved hypothetical protein [Candidatus Desulfarcum epimagneticum]|uniref:DUF1778 domain-containing protein n=1 Tax=uncultured Desulfobacteraceae bacterium TaxID=218296 RepID=A0A484HMD5_9BACT|nr:conserved hypothetical protein [uncultured Desulfobacteraceae bacterium]